MAEYFKTQGIILKHEEAGEYDALISCYSKNFGKIDVLAKGIKKINAKLAGHLQIPSLNNLEIVSNKIYRLIGTSVIKNFSNIKKNREALENALYICEITDKLIGHPLREEKLWRLLNAALAKIEKSPDLSVYVNILYQAKLIKILGYEPDISQIKDRAIKELFRNDKIIDIEKTRKWLREYIEKIRNGDVV